MNNYEGTIVVRVKVCVNPDVNSDSDAKANERVNLCAKAIDLRRLERVPGVVEVASPEVTWLRA